MTKVAVAQFAMKSGLPNLDRIAAMSAKAAEAEAELIVFPELCLPGYDLPQLKNRARPSEEESTASLQEIAQKTGIAIFTGVATEHENIVLFISADKTLLRYSKTHLFDFKTARESDLFRRGNEPIKTTHWKDFSVAPLICFDLRFPELARHYHANGANLYLVSSAWPYSRAEVFFTLGRARAIENQAYLLSSNFVGQNGSGDRFAGSSAIFAPDGSILAQLNSQEEGILLADISIDAISQTRDELNCLAKQRGLDFYT